MNPDIFDEAVAVIKNYFDSRTDGLSEVVLRDLWAYPIDFVIRKYQIPSLVMDQFYATIANIDYRKLAIKPYHDYAMIHEFNHPKVLVTTGLRILQNAKINALGIRKDFEAIHIDDPTSIPRNDKLSIFQRLLEASNLKAEQFWVIGDNPDSELKAARILGMKSVQRSSKTKNVSNEVHHYIDSFSELRGIIH